MKPIRSRDNSEYKSLVRLVRSARARRESGTIVLDGAHLIAAYIDRFSAQDMRIFAMSSKQNDREIASLLAQPSSVMLLDDTLFERAAAVQTPTGILAIAPKPTVVARTSMGFQVVLEGLQDPGNVGAILRSGAAAGALAAHLSTNCADPWSPKALRGGMGAQFVLPIYQHEDMVAAIAGLDLRLIGCTADAQISLFDADLRGKVGFIIGAEGAGISEVLRRQAHQLLCIPMSEGIESLNAAAAASVIFYERFRQTRNPSN